MNFGQMLMLHIVFCPSSSSQSWARTCCWSACAASATRCPSPGPSSTWPQATVRESDRVPWRGPTSRYDILKEATIATVVILVLTVRLAKLLSSPDVPPVTVRTWAQVAPADFLATAGTNSTERA